MKKILITLVILFFLFLRLYRINSSFFYFNDMGRDSLVLYQWQQTGKPPLLGPQNSALPFNQSPIYFYLLYPIFLITNGSPLSAIYTNLLLYLFTFTILFISFRKSPHFWATIFTILVISVHPQQVIQSRFVWNPSFVSAFLLLGLWALVEERIKLATICLSLAIACSFSVLPTIIALTIGILFCKRKIFVRFLLNMFLFTLIFHFPIILFELRHHFQLTKSVFLRGTEMQIGFSYVQQINKINQYVFLNQNIFWFTSMLFITLLVGIFYYKTKNKNGLFFFIIFTINLISTTILPINFQSHYIFGLLVTFIFLLSFLPKPIFIILLTPFLLKSVNPNQILSYFSPAPRTYEQLMACFQNYCQTNKTPTFVSVQSEYHPFHNGPEHRYLLQKSGCIVYNIEDDSNKTNQMTVVVDGGQFSPEKTSYNELTTFGPYTVKRT